jgi:hypothetical protein
LFAHVRGGNLGRKYDCLFGFAYHCAARSAQRGIAVQTGPDARGGPRPLRSVRVSRLLGIRDGAPDTQSRTRSRAGRVCFRWHRWRHWPQNVCTQHPDQSRGDEPEQMAHGATVDWIPRHLQRIHESPNGRGSASQDLDSGVLRRLCYRRCQNQMISVSTTPASRLASQAHNVRCKSASSATSAA